VLVDSVVGEATGAVVLGIVLVESTVCIRLVSVVGLFMERV